MRTGNGFIRTVPGGRKADPIILDNAFARTGKRELVKIRAWAPIIVLDLYSSLYGCFLLPNISAVITTSQATIEQKESPKGKKIDRRRDRTCNLLIRSQAPCHWASRPV
ncbi:hypothetical protein ACN42_g8604 [Penicillium freii]|uniref:Uncharacterized protein n=1 Tax=Penicillium freii TaxID=48697 RepID=A0A124GQM5_PENFR|nr:hypothetical protein ACN42_g8604 [Penicillium freii]